MDIEKFLENLSAQEYAELEKYILDKKKERENSGLKILDFIEANKNNMSVRVKKVLLLAAETDIYVKNLNRAKLHRYRYIGAKTLTELEFLLSENMIDRTYFFKKYILE